MERFIIFDLEYTAWEGSRERGWAGEGEHKEVIQIGAMKVQKETLQEIDSLSLLVKPAINPELSDYIQKLTGITQDQVAKNSLTFPQALEEFSTWSEDLPIYSWGIDQKVLLQNAELAGCSFPFDSDRFHNLRNIFEQSGKQTGGCESGEVLSLFGKEPSLRPHDALNDSRILLEGLRELRKEGEIFW